MLPFYRSCKFIITAGTSITEKMANVRAGMKNTPEDVQMAVFSAMDETACMSEKFHKKH